MGFLRAALPGIRPDDLAAAAELVLTTPTTLDLASPWAPTHQLSRVLDGVVFYDVFGPAAVRPVTRSEAMTVPAVARARHIIAGTTGVIPLRSYQGAAVLDGRRAPSWLSKTVGLMPWFHKLVWTADDLLFYGWSCWARTNDVDGRFPLHMERIPMGEWSVDQVTRRVLVADRKTGVHVDVDQRTVCLIPGPHEGILTAAASTIRHAADLQRAASQAAKHPAAYLALVQTQGTPLKYESDDPTDVTVSTTVRDWHGAREGVNGGVAFVPLGLEPKELGTFDAHLVTEGRNAAAVDVARICSLPADLLDAAGESSLTYANARDNDKRAIQYGIGFYLSAISAALSMDTVVPHGTEVRFDLEEWLETPVDDQPTPSTPRQAAARAATVSEDVPA